MADRFDDLMTNMGQTENAAVDYQAMHDAVLLEAKKRQSRRLDLVRTLSAAAVFALIVTSGVIAISRSARSKDAGAPSAAMTAMYDAAYEESAAAEAPVAAEAPAAAYDGYTDEELDSLTADDSATILGCTPETCDEPAAEAPAGDSGAGGPATAASRSSDPQFAAAQILSLSSGKFFTVGAPDFDSCAAICFTGTEALGDCWYTTMDCPERVLDIGQAYIVAGPGGEGGASLMGLWQILDDEYVLVECFDPDMTAEGLADILRGMAKQS